ncbi:YebY family protein [Klebsiella pneumoniae]|nr:YebY family protein [Klebsiella pneumoniae]
MDFIMRSLFAIGLLVLCSTAFAAEKTQALDGASFGNTGPLTFEKAMVSCVNGAYAFVHDTATDNRYPLNGMASSAVKSGKMEGYDLDTVWKDDPNYSGVKMSMSPVLDSALNLCK